MIKIWCPPHVAFAAQILCKNLQSLGHTANIVDNIASNDLSIYIIYTAAKVKKLPPNYIVYQTEVAGSDWFSNRYLKTISKALAVWEYSEKNLSEYQHLNKNISIVTPGISLQPVTTKDIPVLFYGYVKKSPLRQQLLAEISQSIDMVIVEDKLLGDMWQLLARAEKVLNLHYYENAPLEVFRINEALSFGCEVISQSTEETEEKYSGLVSFADDVEQLTKLLKQSATPAIKSAKARQNLDNHNEIKAAMATDFPLVTSLENPIKRTLRRLLNASLYRS